VIDLSVVICTYNRASVLIDTLRSYSEMRGVNDPAIELLVVDNNSNDSTVKVVDEYSLRLPGLRYVFEPAMGVSHARNTGIREAKGRLVAFVDDDVWFDQGWLEAVLQVFTKYPEASCMGGCSIPHFQSGRPVWLTDNLLSYYGSTLSGEQVKWMVYPEYPYGLNMAFRCEVFAAVGLFNTFLGRKKKNLLSKEETDYFYRVSQVGLKVIYTPKALLYHRIPSERTEPSWILSRHYWQGVSNLAFKQIHRRPSRLELLAKMFKLLSSIVLRSIGNGFWFHSDCWYIARRKFQQKLAHAEDLGKLSCLLKEILLL